VSSPGSGKGDVRATYYMLSGCLRRYRREGFEAVSVIRKQEALNSLDAVRLHGYVVLRLEDQNRNETFVRIDWADGGWEQPQEGDNCDEFIMMNQREGVYVAPVAAMVGSAMVGAGVTAASGVAASSAASAAAANALANAAAAVGAANAAAGVSAGAAAPLATMAGPGAIVGIVAVAGVSVLVLGINGHVRRFEQDAQFVPVWHSSTQGIGCLADLADSIDNLSDKRPTYDLDSWNCNHAANFVFFKMTQNEHAW